MNVAYNMDCMEYMRALPDKAFDLAVVDPPYGIGEDGGKDRNHYVTQKNGARLYVKDGGYKKTGFDHDPVDDTYFAELFRVSKNQIIWGQTILCFLAAEQSCGTSAMTGPISLGLRLRLTL